MQFIINYTGENIVRISRKIGYQILGDAKNNEFNLVRPLGRNFYPRFHLYVKQEPGSIIFNLHLDQKKPSYPPSSRPGGTTEGQSPPSPPIGGYGRTSGFAHAHSGEYEGELVVQEAERIKQILNGI